MIDDQDNGMNPGQDDEMGPQEGGANNGADSEGTQENQGGDENGENA